MSNESFLAYVKEQEEKENAERRMLNSGFAAFHEWEEGKKSASAWRSQWRRRLDSVTADGGQRGPSRCELDRVGEWSKWTPCLVYAFDNDYSCDEPLSLDKLRGRDRAVADMILDATDGFGDNMYFCTLLVFERTVCGTRCSTATSKRIRKKNDEDIFVGYDTFSEIETDEVCITRWSDMEGGSACYSGGGYGALDKDDEAMFVESILNEGGLRGMFVGRTPDESDDDSCTFSRDAIVICPVKNITKLDEAGPLVAANRSWWVLRAGCRAAPDRQIVPPSLYDQREPKKEIARHVMKEFKERTAKELLERQFPPIYDFLLEMLMEILKDAKCVPLMLEMTSILATGAKELPHNEKLFSEVISDALIYLHSTETTSAEKEDICRLAKDRLSYLMESTKDGKPTLTHRQEEAVFNESAKFASDVQAFLRSDLEEKEFGPFRDNEECEKWANSYFGWISGSRCVSNSIEGGTAENIGRYKAQATVDLKGAAMTVTVKKSSSCMLRKWTKLYDLHVAALEKLSPVFAELVD